MANKRSPVLKVLLRAATGGLGLTKKGLRKDIARLKSQRRDAERKGLTATVSSLTRQINRRQRDLDKM